MHWKEFDEHLTHTDRARLMRSLQEGRLYGGLAARAEDRTEVEWMVACIDRAIDALAAARILLGAPAEPQPWADASYRAYRGHHPTSELRLRPAELSALRHAVEERAAARAELAVSTSV